ALTPHHGGRALIAREPQPSRVHGVRCAAHGGPPSVSPSPSGARAAVSRRRTLREAKAAAVPHAALATGGAAASSSSNTPTSAGPILSPGAVIMRHAMRQAVSI